MNRSSMPKQVMTFSNGGLASFIPRQTKIAGQPHMLAYINPQEEQILQDYRGNAPVVAGPAGVPSYLFGFTSIKDMFDGGGRGGSGANFSTGTHEEYVAANPDDRTARAHNTGGSDDRSSGGRDFDADMSAGSGRDYSSQDDTYTSDAGALPRDVGLVDSLMMGVGLKDRTPAYYSATADTIARTQGADAAARYINQMNEAGNFSDADASSLLQSTAYTAQDAIDRGLLTLSSSDDDNGSGSDQTDGDDQTDGEEGDGEEEEDGPPSSMNFRFFGGYSPVSRSDVLVPSSFQQDITTPDARLDPMFPQRPEPVYRRQDDEVSGGIDYGGGGFTPSLISGPGMGATPGPQMPGQGQFATMQELMEYQQQNPTMNLIGEYQRLKALEGGAAQPAVLPQRGIASLMGADPATESMYQGIMS
jgi:hypothetical protein